MTDSHFVYVEHYITKMTISQYFLIKKLTFSHFHTKIYINPRKNLKFM